jgi:hypothetical protein
MRAAPLERRTDTTLAANAGASTGSNASSSPAEMLRHPIRMPGRDSARIATSAESSGAAAIAGSHPEERHTKSGGYCVAVVWSGVVGHGVVYGLLEAAFLLECVSQINFSNCLRHPNWQSSVRASSGRNAEGGPKWPKQ